MIALLSNVTIEMLAERVKKITGEEIYTPSGYNNWAQELMSGSFGGVTPEAVFVILDGTQLLGNNFANNWEKTKETLDSALNVILSFKNTHLDITIFVASLDIPKKKVLTYTSARIEEKAAAYWLDVLYENNMAVIDIAEEVREIGRNKFYSTKMWYLGSAPYTSAGETAIADEILNCLNAWRGKRAKCIVLDLDNTLWGGVIGEDGVGGIELSPTNQGARYYDFQKRLKEIKDTGVILSIVSKNNAEDAMAAINGHPDMLLREEDFAAIKANWLPKYENIAALAKELNLGLDSFVFIDDNPVERESVKIALPQVIVPEFPKDTANLERFIISVAKKYFPVMKLTQEDLTKTQSYRNERRREELRNTSTTMEEYLKSLKMKLTVFEAGEDDVQRVAQMTQKTNQFNLTTKRYTENDILHMKECGSYKIWLGSLSDKFGDYGKIILAIAEIDADRAKLDTFLMSCRAMGRNVEYDFIKEIEKSLASVGVKQIEAEYIPTPKNSVVKNFYSTANGWKLTDMNENKTRYIKNLF